MGLYEATQEMAKRLDVQDKETDQKPVLPKDLAAWAERRHLFWRSRCMDHARTIDCQLKRIHELIDTIRALEKQLGQD